MKHLFLWGILFLLSITWMQSKPASAQNAQPNSKTEPAGMEVIKYGKLKEMIVKQRGKVVVVDLWSVY